MLVPLEGFTDGESLYQRWLSGTPSTPNAAAAPASPSDPPTPGYPPPIYRAPGNVIGGYYLDGQYSDVAVLSVPSFVSAESQEIPFQQVGEKFLAAARAAGKKKLIIDVSANGGGTILQGYDLYKQLFPKGVGHAAADRFRDFESTKLLTEYYSRASQSLPRELVDEDVNATLYGLEVDVVSSVFNYQTDLDVNSKNFRNWQAKYGPGVSQKGDQFSNLFRWNLSDVLTPYNSGGIYVHGYGPLANYTAQQQPFATEDIVVVTDGYCASTCTIFSELMRQRAGVKYISLGGRAKSGITQAVGGVKGTNDLPWDYIQYLTQLAVTNLTTSAAEARKLNQTELGDYWDNTPFNRQAPSTSININFRDGIRDGDKSQTPLQFVYEPSDCRILYTKAMTVDVTAIWKAVADSAFGGTNHCISGSLGGYRKMAKREMTAEDIALNKRMHEWRRDLSAEHYPLDLYTDLRGADLSRRGIMWP